MENNKTLKELLEELCNLYQDFLSESEAYDGADFWGNKRVKEIEKQLSITDNHGK